MNQFGFKYPSDSQNGLPQMLYDRFRFLKTSGLSQKTGLNDLCSDDLADSINP
jgi:hypothetical protein